MAADFPGSPPQHALPVPAALPPVRAPTRDLMA
jgi:hypothetical protein